MKQPAISVLVTTYNNRRTLDACLQSIKDQTLPASEIIVVDNHSTDETLAIARRYTEHVYTRGPERCAQRNYGIQQATGDYIVVIDSDMELNPDVLQGCADVVTADPEIAGVIIPEESFGEGFWAQCKRLERSFYVGVDWIEAARFFRRKALLEVGGYNESLVSGEDWDLSQRIGTQHKLGRTTAFIRHNEGRFKLFTTLRKKSYYAKKFTAYTALQKNESRSLESNNDSKSTAPQNTGADHNPYVIVLKRYALFFSHPIKLFHNPVLGIGMLFMKTCEFGFGAFGYLLPDPDKTSTPTTAKKDTV